MTAAKKEESETRRQQDDQSQLLWHVTPGYVSFYVRLRPKFNSEA